ncbi:MAG: hypothetical protein HUU01_08835 [Saprospiraceae bacterium]|nr:hypothetical protein [Saprospiraceae bacterium]
MPKLFIRTGVLDHTVAYTGEHRQCIKAVNKLDTPSSENEFVSTSLETTTLWYGDKPF